MVVSLPLDLYLMHFAKLLLGLFFSNCFPTMSSSVHRFQHLSHDLNQIIQQLTSLDVDSTIHLIRCFHRQDLTSLCRLDVLASDSSWLFVCKKAMARTTACISATMGMMQVNKMINSMLPRHLSTTGPTSHSAIKAPPVLTVPLAQLPTVLSVGVVGCVEGFRSASPFLPLELSSILDLQSASLCLHHPCILRYHQSTPSVT